MLPCSTLGEIVDIHIYLSIHSMLAVRLSKFAQILMLTIHLTACVWYGIACPLDECREDSWAIELGKRSQGYYSLTGPVGRFNIKTPPSGPIQYKDTALPI